MRQFLLPTRAALNVVLNRPQPHIGFANRQYSTSYHGSLSHTLTGSPTDSSWLYACHESSEETHSQVELLLRLVTKKRFGAAERVFLSIADAGEMDEIPLHPVFERAALSALQWDDESRRVQQFITWFNLVPDIYHPDSVVSSAKNAGRPMPKQPFHRTMDTLFRAGKPTANLSLINSFALVCASKGYIRSVYGWVVPFLAAQPVSSTALVDFLIVMEKDAIDYETAYSARRARVLTSQLRAAAVEFMSRSGRHAAVQKIFARNASDKETLLPNTVYDYAIQRLEQGIGEEGRGGRRLSQRVGALKRLREIENAKRYSTTWRPLQQVELKHVSTTFSCSPLR
ncbi:hypothetical protein JOM56_000092 [Amanita muscaria]